MSNGYFTCVFKQATSSHAVIQFFTLSNYQCVNSCHILFNTFHVVVSACLFLKTLQFFRGFSSHCFEIYVANFLCCRFVASWRTLSWATGIMYFGKNYNPHNRPVDTLVSWWWQYATLSSHCKTLPKIKSEFHREFSNSFLLTLLNLAGRLTGLIQTDAAWLD